MFFHFNLLNLSMPHVLPVILYSLLYQVASLANTFFFAALTSDIHKVPALAIKVLFGKIKFFRENTLFTLLNK